MAFLIVGKPSEPTSSAIVDAARELGLEAAALEPAKLGSRLGAGRARVGDIVLGRLCIRASLAGVERGLDELSRAVARGVFVLNPPTGILAASDKLATALRLARAGVPHPRTALVGGGTLPAAGFPAVVKPRFGTGGLGVTVCEDAESLERHLDRLRHERWYRRHGAVLQELVPVERELRLVVAGGRVVAGAEGESAAACRLALSAAAATETDVGAVDVVDSGGTLIVLDLDPAPVLEDARPVVQALFADVSPALPRIA
jgi:glutathione synthase/RimK-type ligase-like ATP-grasp enzyme